MKLTSRISLFSALFAALLLTGAARAGVVEGSIFENAVGATDAIPANVPGTTPDVTFTTTTPINFASGSLYTIGEFLSSGNGSTILSGSSQLGNTLDNTLFNFTGSVSVTSGESFTAGHDDGLTLIIDGLTVINAPGPTGFALTTETYTGPTGTFAFQLVYGECCGAPADLSISLPLQSSGTTTPEPGSALLLGLGLFGVGAVSRTRDFSRVSGFNKTTSANTNTRYS